MPLPSPKSNEDKKEFVNKCMDDSVMLKEFPNDKQRAAVCYSQYDEVKKKKFKSSSKITWGDQANYDIIIF
jgi:hypothetical protein